MMRELILGVAAVVVVGGLVAAWIALGGREAPRVQPDVAAFENNERDKPVDEKQPLAFDALNSPEEREDYIRKLAAEPDAKWNDPVLREAIVGDRSARAQLAAMEESMRLARAKGGSAPSEAVRMGLESSNGNTRAAALKAAKENADPAMVYELIELVNQGDAYAPVALNALACTNDARDHAKFLAIVEDTNADRTLRERAVALIGVTKDREAIGALIELRNGGDAVLARIAEEVLKKLDE